MKTSTALKFGFLSLVLMTSVSLATVTIASFADPSDDSANPIFTLVTDGVSSGTFSGGWDDSQTGLGLKIFEDGSLKETIPNVFFQMSDLTYTGLGMVPFAGTTNGGWIKFFADNADPGSTDPLFMITFNSAAVNIGGLGGSDAFFSSDNVVFSGTAIQDTISDETFSFNLANQVLIQDDTGFTATASFDSSATVPEPMSLGLLMMGLGILRRFPKK